MRNSRKILIGMLAAAGLAAAGSLVYADPPGGYGAGYGPCASGAGGPGAGGGGYGPGMMGYGGGHHGGYGPGMGGGGPRGGHGQGMMGGGPRAGFGPGACGQGGPGSAACDGSGPGRGAGATPAERSEARLSFLKNELKITEDQEAAWDAYAKQAKTRAETMQAFHAQGPITAETPAERIEQHAARMKLRADQEQAMSVAVKDLFAVLTPEQKTIANRYFGGMRVGQAGPRGHGRGRWN